MLKTVEHTQALQGLVNHDNCTTKVQAVKGAWTGRGGLLKCGLTLYSPCRSTEHVYHETYVSFP